MANIAVLVYSIAGQLAHKHNVIYDNTRSNKENNGTEGTAAMLLLFIVLFYFIYLLVTRQFSVFGNYTEFKDASFIKSTLYRYILLIYSCATVYMVYSNSQRRSLNYIIWLVIALLLFVTGNKGEVLYPLLSAVGAIGIKNRRIDRKYILVGFLLLFIVIPSITSLRKIGILTNLTSISFDFTGAFTEMGMQIRTSVYSLDKLEKGNISLLLGKSYYQPIFNIINDILFFIKPFPNEVARNFIDDYVFGGGYSQVIESYMNFGIIGIFVYFGFVGFFILSKEEQWRNDKLKICYLGCIVSVLINASRNYFAFVPGQILIVSILYCVIKVINVGMNHNQ